VLGEAFSRMTANLRQLVGQVQSAAVDVADSSRQLGEVANTNGQAVQQVNEAMQNVATGAQQSSSAAQDTNASVAQLSQAIDVIAEGVAEQARQVSSASATATSMATGMEHVAGDASSVAAAGQQTRQVAERGAAAVHETVTGMQDIQVVVSEAVTKVADLGKLGTSIGAVVETIDDIAEQTNLLALNAAIEAARAGEHGR